MEFVYDRTQADVDRAKELNEKYIQGTISEAEKMEWSEGLKGALNINDINRVESNTEEIGEKVAAFTTVKTWQSGDIPSKTDYKRIIQNVKTIRESYAALSDTPDTPEQPLNTFEKWNDIERILHDVNYVYERVKQAGYYCGENYCGEEIGVI